MQTIYIGSALAVDLPSDSEVTNKLPAMPVISIALA